MSKKKKSKSTPPRVKPPKAINPRAQEQMFRQIAKMLAASGASTEDEVKAELARIASGPLPEPGQLSQLERADMLAAAAFDFTGLKRVELFVRALAISEDCADAYCGLADNVDMPIFESVNLYARAVEAGERAIGDALRTEVGHFWIIHETRPYMRARLSLAAVLDELDRTDEAIEHLYDLQRLDPLDHIGSRYVLLPMLLRERRLRELRELFVRYDEDASPEWYYDRALLSFLDQSPDADELLVAAIERNQHVVPYLLGTRRLPPRVPATSTFGGVEEAAIYADEAIDNWLDVPGAIDWLKARAQSSR